MSHSIRFIGIAIIAWAGVRAVSLGLVPGAEALAFDRPADRPPPTRRLAAVRPTALPPIDPRPSATAPAYATYGSYPPDPPPPAYGGPGYAPYPVYIPVPAAIQRTSPPVVRHVGFPWREPPPAHPYFEPVPPIEQWQGTAFAAPTTQVTPSFAESNAAPTFDRMQLSTWAMLRDRPGAIALAEGGTLGGSQAGARLLWRFNPHLAASLRTSTPINSQRGGEAALGVRYQPFVNFPLAITAERRQSLGKYGGRNAFAMFAEGGLYSRPMPWKSSLDAYLQAGVVGAKRREWFVDGSAAVTRPVWRNLSAGLGVWGGAQPGLTRIDAGPRASLRVGRRMRVHLDYRQKVAGNALPGSGGVVTIAGDF